MTIGMFKFSIRKNKNVTPIQRVDTTLCVEQAVIILEGFVISLLNRRYLGSFSASSFTLESLTSIIICSNAVKKALSKTKNNNIINMKRENRGFYEVECNKENSYTDDVLWGFT